MGWSLYGRVCCSFSCIILAILLGSMFAIIGGHLTRIHWSICLRADRILSLSSHLWLRLFLMMMDWLITTFIRILFNSYSLLLMDLLQVISFFIIKDAAFILSFEVCPQKYKKYAGVLNGIMLQVGILVGTNLAIPFSALFVSNNDWYIHQFIIYHLFTILISLKLNLYEYKICLKFIPINYEDKLKKENKIIKERTF